MNGEWWRIKAYKKKTKLKRIRAAVTRMRVLLVLALVCVLAFGVSVAYAKYRIELSRRNDAVTAKEFYFSSDLLDGEVHEIPALDGKGSAASVTFHVMNHEDQLRYSDVDITYQLKVSPYAEVQASIGNENLQKSLNAENGGITGIIESGSLRESEITLYNLEPGQEYEVTATAIKPYHKTLTGTIRVKAADNTIYTSLNDKDAYIEVTVWTIDYAQGITLQYASSLIPDNTDPLMREAKTGEQLVLTAEQMGSNTSHIFRFFKSDAAKTDYQVTAAEGTVTVQ